MLEREFAYYKAHKQELQRRYMGQHVVIAEETVQGHFDTEMEAYIFGMQNFKPGTFLIQEIQEGDTADTQTFHSRVIYFK